MKVVQLKDQNFSKNSLSVSKRYEKIFRIKIYFKPRLSMKNKLTKEEKDLNRAIDAGEYISANNLAAEKKKYATAVKNTIAKNKVITVRLSERNLIHLKAAAAREGVLYQTFVSALIQKHT